MKTNKPQKQTLAKYEEDPVDQAHLDLHFVEAFIDLLYGLSRDKGTLDEVKTSTISAMCFESKFKIESLQAFISSVPLKSQKAA